MLGSYLDNKPIYFFNNDSTHPVTRGEPDDLTLLTIKVGFAAVTVLLTIGLAIICIMAFS
jgi:hypothetical protein